MLVKSCGVCDCLDALSVTPRDRNGGIWGEGHIRIVQRYRRLVLNHEPSLECRAYVRVLVASISCMPAEIDRLRLILHIASIDRSPRAPHTRRIAGEQHLRAIACRYAIWFAPWHRWTAKTQPRARSDHPDAFQERTPFHDFLPASMDLFRPRFCSWNM
jgi:hypothetical protein